MMGIDANPATVATGAQRTAWRHSVLSNDIDVHAACQQDWQLDYVQISAGRFSGAIEHLQLSGLRLVRESSSCVMRQMGQLGPRNYGFAMPMELSGEALFNGWRLERDAIMLGRTNDLDLCTPSGFQMCGIVVDADLLESLRDRIYGAALPVWFDRQVVVRVPTQVAENIRSSVLQAFDNVERTPTLLDDAAAVEQLRDAVLIEWLEALPGDVDLSDLKSVAARRRVVSRACEIMLSQPGEPVSTLQVCSRIGASRRKLNYCFQDVLGISPARYLRAVRLNGARRELKNPGDPRLGVQDIAARWGFWHLGHFSADYKHQFSELPSETLRAKHALIV